MRPSETMKRRALRGAVPAAVAALAVLVAEPAAAADIYVKAIGGFSVLGVDTLDVDLGGGDVGRAGADFDPGFAAGLALGFELGESWLVEAEYLYRTNGLNEVTLPGGMVYSEGDYSSVALSGLASYLFRDAEARWRPYVGFGVGWLQEIDIDFEEADGTELSWETDGFGWQVSGGVRARLAQRWSLDLEARYFSAGDLDMEARGERVTADYDPLGVNVGVAFHF